MPRKRASQQAKSDHVFGQARKAAKILWAGLYARVSTTDQQTLAMQNRAMWECAARRGWMITLQVREVNSGAARRESREGLLEAAAAARSIWCWSGGWTVGAGRSRIYWRRSRNSNTSELSQTVTGEDRSRPRRRPEGRDPESLRPAPPGTASPHFGIGTAHAIPCRCQVR